MGAFIPLGRVVATPGALKLLEETGEDPRLLLARHRSEDWSKLYKHDCRENEGSLKHGWRILSSYPVSDRPLMQNSFLLGLENRRSRRSPRCEGHYRA